MLQRLWNAAELAAAPGDESIPSRTRGDKRAWVYGFNLSPFVFEIQNDKGQAETIALPFCPFKHPLDARSEQLTIHKIGTMVPAAPLAAADLAFYITVSEFEPDLIPGPW
jgi:hypothetical protein